MARRDDLSYLDENLAGPILKVEDPRKYSKEDILKSYYREIVLMANKYTRPNIDRVDLVSAGIEGLLDAIERWNPKKAKGNPKNFHNLAIVRIKNYMYNHFLENGGRYKIPSYMARGLNYLSQVRRVIDDSEYPGDREEVILNWESPDFEEWASPESSKKLKVKKKKIKDLAKSMNQDYEKVAEKILNAEKRIEAYEQSATEEVRNPEEIAANKEYLEDLLNSLTPETREIIKLSLEGRTLDEIGEIQGKTKARIQQIRSKFLKVLQNTRMYRSSLEE